MSHCTPLRPFGSFELHAHHCDNSMEWAKKVLCSNPHGTLLYADKHDAVRGRHGRTWEQMPGQLLLTYLVKPDNTSTLTTSDEHGATPLMYLYYALNLGLNAGIGQFRPECTIKWPNDCILGDRKVAGMLLEPVWSGSDFQGMVLGIGVNVNNRFARGSEMEHVAVSIRTFDLHGAYDELEVLESINKELTHWYQVWHDGDYNKIWRKWRKHHLPQGTAITVHLNNGKSASGIIDEPLIDGSLIIKTGKTGRRRTLKISDVISLLPEKKD